MAKFPDPEYFYDEIDGHIVKAEDGLVLVVGSADIPADAIRGPFRIRYALPTLMPPIRDVFPGLFVGERGGAVTGRKAWDYMQDRWIHHPRADVVGIFPDGEKAQLFLKELDFGRTVRVYAFTAEDKLIGPLTRMQVAEGVPLPDLLVKYLPRT